MINNIYAYKLVNTASTVQIVTGACTLGRVNIPATTVGTITVIDGTSGSTANIAYFPAGSGFGTYEFDVTCALGLRVITSSSSDSITFTFKSH